MENGKNAACFFLAAAARSLPQLFRRGSSGASGGAWVRIPRMIGILLITHGSFGEALVQNACHVLNKRPPLLNQLGVAAQDDPLDLLPLAQKTLALVNEGDGALVLTDIFGASPANLALKLLQPGHVEGLAGVNLPMLLRALTYRDRGMETLLMRARDGGRDGVINMLDH